GGSAADGAGIFNLGGYLTITDVAVRDNAAANDGGGIFNAGGTVTVSNSTLANNVADSNQNTTGDGGGFFNQSGGTVRINNSTVSDNSAVSGGGLFNDGAAEGTASTFPRNPAVGGEGGGEGGAIWNSGGTVTLVNSTLSDNEALARAEGGGPGEGGGLYQGFAPGSVTALNVTLFRNRASIGGNIFTDGIGNLTLRN